MHYLPKVVFYLVIAMAFCIQPAVAFPRKKLVPSSKTTEFSRQPTKLSSSSKPAISGTTSATTPQIRSNFVSREALLRFDAVVGVLYSSGFLLFPGKTLSLFFDYDFDPSLTKFLHLTVRMIAINHLGYVAGLLMASPELAIKVATAFLTVGGALIVYYGQAKLETAVAFWSCTILTTAMIVAHWMAL